MDQVYVIRHKVLKEGKSARKVASEMSVGRNTIKKYLRCSEPIYEGNVQRNQTVCQVIAPRIAQLLEEWKHRVTPKQRVTGRLLLSQLKEEGFETGLTSVIKCLRELKRRNAEVFIPLVHRPGDEAQVDFFEVQVDVSGQRRKAWLFLMRLMYSGRDFAAIYEHADQVSFLDGHVRAFQFFGGVPARCVYDNLKAAVSRRVGAERKLSGRFLALVSHYLFEPCFARVATGHDKGGVEARGKGLRWRYLTPIPKGDSLESISQALLKRLDQDSTRVHDREGKTVQDKMMVEQPQLRALPKYPFEPRKVIPLNVNRQATVQVAGATYSVPCHWNRLMLQAFVGPSDIRFICRGETIVRERVPPKQKQIYYRDYLPELAKKPQALRQVAPELLNELSEPFQELWQILEKSYGAKGASNLFARLLSALVKQGEPTVGRVLQKVFNQPKTRLFSTAPVNYLTENEVPEPLRQYVVESPRASDFDFLLRGAVV